MDWKPRPAGILATRHHPRLTFSRDGPRRGRRDGWGPSAEELDGIPPQWGPADPASRGPAATPCHAAALGGPEALRDRSALEARSVDQTRSKCVVGNPMTDPRVPSVSRIGSTEASSGSPATTRNERSRNEMNGPEKPATERLAARSWYELASEVYDGDRRPVTVDASHGAGSPATRSAHGADAIDCLAAPAGDAR